MSLARLGAFLGIGLMLSATSTEARELQFSFDGRLAGDSNVFRTNARTVEDGFAEFAPAIALRERNAELTYDFRYEPSYVTYFDTSGIDGFDHVATGVLAWTPTPVDRLNATGRFSSTRRVRLIDANLGVAPVPDLEESDRERLNRSNASLSYGRALTPRLSVNGSASFDDFDGRNGPSVDTRGYAGLVSFNYRLDPKTSVGASGTYRRRDGLGRVDTRTDIWNVALIFSRQLTNTTRLFLQGGPSFIESQVDSFPIQNDSDETFFALASLESRWEKTRVDLSYTRTEARSGGEASSSIADSVSLRFDHDVDRQWSVRGLASWNLRQEFVSTGARGRVDITFYQIFFTVERNITPRLVILGRYTFQSQDRDRDGLGNDDSLGEIHLGFVGLRYNFDPIVF